MNFTERKHEARNLRWEPFATSTPIMRVSVNARSKNEIYPMKPPVFVPDLDQKLSGVSKNYRNKQCLGTKNKTGGKNRSKAYFDLTSSSDDEDVDCRIEKNRPIIKIGTGNAGKINLVAANGKRNSRLKVGENHSNSKNSGNKKRQNIKCITQIRPENAADNRSVSNSDLENLDLSAIKERNLPSTVTKVSPEHKKPLRKTLRVLQNSKKGEKQAKNLINEKSILKVSNENNKESSQKLLKRRGAKNKNTVGVKKSRQTQMVSSENQQLPVNKHTNSSHQLFTDSTQEALINTLCLTSSEMKALDVNIDFPKVIQKSLFKSETNSKFKPPGSIEGKGVKEIVNIVEKQERPKRTRQPPQEYWVINDKSKPLKDKGKGTRVPMKKTVKAVAEREPVQLLNNSVSALNAVAANNLRITQTASKDREILIGQDDLIIKNEELDKKLDSKSKTNAQSDLGIKNDEVPTINTKPEQVFLPLNEISYVENEFGHQVSQVCSTKNLKCGVIKLKPGSNFKWKKSQRNTYMGGVLVKGEMQMTVGDSKQTLQEGDMVLVPPLSECQASNTGECDFIFYYWCMFTK